MEWAGPCNRVIVLESTRSVHEPNLRAQIRLMPICELWFLFAPFYLPHFFFLMRRILLYPTYIKEEKKPSTEAQLRLSHKKTPQLSPSSAIKKNPQLRPSSAIKKPVSTHDESKAEMCVGRTRASSSTERHGPPEPPLVLYFAALLLCSWQSL